MKLLILFFSIFSFDLIYAKFPINSKCAQDSLNISNEMNSLNQWSRRGETKFVSPTKKFGEWIYLNEDNSEIEISKINNLSKLTYIVNKKNCEKRIKVSEINKKSPLIETDSELESHIHKSKGIIYLWSPHMPLSYTGIRTVEKLARNLQLKLLIYVDPSIQDKVSKKYSKKYIKKINSLELRMRNAYLHFPTILSFNHGKIGRKVKYGYETYDEYEKNIKNMFGN